MSGTYSYANYDIDLDDLEDTTDPDKIVNICSQLVDADSDFKIFPARQWIENFLYFAGIRDIHSRFATGTVVGNTLLSNIFPSTANISQTYRRRIAKVFKACQIQAQNITKQRPSIKVWPESDDENAVKKAKLGNILVDYLWDEDGENDIYYECLLWALLTPAVARKDYLDFSFNRTRVWPMTENVVNPITGQPTQKVKVDEAGNPILQQLPWNKSEIISAFRLIFNPSANWVNELDFIGDISIKRIQWVHQNFSNNSPGYFPENLERLKKGQWKFTPIMAMENAIKQLTFGAFRSYRNWNYSNTQMKDGVSYINLYVRPSPNYPDGREIAVANGLLLYDGPSRVYRDAPFSWHPHSLLCYERVPGRIWGTTYAEKITDINRAYEQARSEFDQLRRTFTKPKLTLPIGAQIDRDTITGDEQIFRYNPYGPDGGKPAYLAAPQPPTTIVDDTKLIAQEFVEMSGVTEIMQGIRPQGVTTYRGLEVLREEASNAANNLIRMYESFIQQSQINKLENIRRSVLYPDKNLVNAVKIFKQMNHYVTDIDIVDFVGDDLSGHIKIEPLSSISKSKLAMQEKYISLAQMGALGDVVNDPDLNNEFKRKMDILGFDRPENKHVVYARWENQMMLSAEKKGAPINPPVMPWHDDALHIREIDMLLNDPTIQDKPLILQSLVAHRDAHLQSIAMKQAQQMMSAMQTPQPGLSASNKPPAKGGQNVIAGQGESGVMFGPEQGFTSQPSGQLV